MGCQVVDMGLGILILSPRFVLCSLFRFLQLFDVFGRHLTDSPCIRCPPIHEPIINFVATLTELEEGPRVARGEDKKVIYCMATWYVQQMKSRV